MSRPWRTVLIILVLSLVLNVGFTYLTMRFPVVFLPPLPGY